MAAIHVFLIRHGETALNAAGVLRGQLDAPLTETGKAEAAALGEMFRKVPLRAIASSPLMRAADTARPVAVSAGLSLEIDDRLRDRFYGEWAGHSRQEIEERFGSIDAAPHVEALPLVEARAGEAFLDAVAAADAAAARDLNQDAPIGVALVTHDAVLRALFDRILPATDLEAVDLPTGSWSELVASPGGGWEALHMGERPGSGSLPDLVAAAPQPSQAERSVLTAPRWTHLALPCRDLDKSVEFYTTVAPLVVVARNEDANGRGAWLSNDRQVETPFVLVLAEFPPAVASEFGQQPGEPVRVLAPFAHIGIELPRREDVDAVADKARALGTLEWEPRQMSPHIGYICSVRDPDGNIVEFSYGQQVFSTVRRLWDASGEANDERV